MDLTSEQVQAIRNGESVPVVPPEVGEECILVRRDAFERAKHGVEDDLPGALAISRMMEAVAEDEDLDFYQQYKR
ncbi:MAG: hypothetical protein GXY83_07465 [Rhodopirellula sp.]|nr:hypothetical protein [Rhodopirellula sp.]